MFRPDVNCYIIAVACCGTYDSLVDTPFPHYLLFPDTVFIRILFKIKIMKKSHKTPEFLFISISEFSCEIFHNTFNYQCMLDVKRVSIIFF